MRLIDAHDYYKELKKEMAWPDRSQEFIDAIEVAIADLGDMPTISPDSLRPKGRWVSLTECSNAGVYCSVCDKKVYKEDYAWCNRKNKLRSNFCPSCGADVREG